MDCPYGNTVRIQGQHFPCGTDDVTCGQCIAQRTGHEAEAQRGGENMRTKLESLKFNLIELVKDHRAKETEDCNVSLMLVRELAELAGVAFTEDEKRLFY